MRPGSAGSGQTGKGHDRIPLLGYLGGGEYRTRETSPKILIAGWVVLVTLGGLEVAVRMWRYSQRHVYDLIYMSYEGAEDIPYIQKPKLVQARTRTRSHQHR
jgi:hypothetical protein